MIQKGLYGGIDTQGGKMMLCQLYAKKKAGRPNVKKHTYRQKAILCNTWRAICLVLGVLTVSKSDAIEWAIRMKEKEFSYKAISNYKRFLKAAFISR